MARRNRNKLLVPQARQGLDELKSKIMGSSNPEDAKFEAANEVGVQLNKGYNGKLTSEQAGKIGGRLGGSMVKELIQMAKEDLNKKQQ
ncbi:small, acid-soluble spore protein, alpha/beta type [Niallia sp. Krafla_26]|uniref:small, acid-soluble spore protein, alpha/beta type n=1 Tax=Niallia sp. Krafla_26 TaxID=3064703 RepID=UPI003D177A87